MKIEIDTEKASKAELEHLASMLRNIASGSSGAVSMTSMSASEPAPASGGLFSLFDDDPAPSEPDPVSTVAQTAGSAPEPAQSGPASGGLFSLFSDDTPSQPASGIVDPYGSVVVDDEEEDDGKPSTAEEILDDDRIVPY